MFFSFFIYLFFFLDVIKNTFIFHKQHNIGKQKARTKKLKDVLLN